MGQRETYLLRTEAQINSFRQDRKDTLHNNAGRILRYIQSLPLFIWMPLRITATQEEMTIGIMCILYIDGFINISFNEDMSRIRREPLNEEELKMWMQNTGCYGPGLRSPHPKTNRKGAV